MSREYLTREEAIGLLEELSAIPEEAARLLIADKEEARRIVNGIQKRVKWQQNKGERRLFKVLAGFMGGGLLGGALGGLLWLAIGGVLAAGLMLFLDKYESRKL